MVEFDVKGTASLSPDKIIESVDAIIEKLDELRDKVDEVDMTIDRLSGKRVEIGVNIDGEDKLEFLRTLLDDLDSRDYHVSIKVGIDGEEKLEALKLEIDDLDAKDHQVNMKIDLNGVDRATADLIALDEELNHKEEDFKKAGKSSDGFQFSLMALLPVLTAVIPVLAAAGGGAIALVGAFSAMVPGLAGVALAAKPAFAAIQTLTKSLNQNTKDALAGATGYQQVYNILNKNSAQFRAMSGEMQDLTVKWFQFKNAYSAFQKAVDPAVFPVIGQGLSIMRTLLSGLPAVTIPAAAALENMLKDFSGRLHDPVFQSFFSDMKKNTYTLVSDWSEGVLNIIEGVVAILHAFMPLSLDVSGGFLKMTESFDKWAQKLQSSKGFQEFVSYVKTNGPVVLDVIKQLVELIAHFGAALSGMGGGALGIIDRILQGLNRLAQTNPGLFKLVTTVALLGITAVKLAPLLGPLIAFLSTPVGAVIAGVALLATGFVLLYTHSKAFHDWVNANLLPMWNKIVDSAKSFVAWAKGLWPDILKIWQLYGRQIVDIVRDIWNFISDVIQGAVKIIEGVIDVFVGLLTGKWSRVWKGLGEILSGAWQIIWSLVRNGMNLILNILEIVGKFILGLFQNQWNQMVDAIKKSVGVIISGVKGGFDTVTRDVVQWGKDVWNAVVSAWNSVTNWVSGVAGRILNALGDLGSLLYNIGASIIEGLWNGMKSAWNDVTGWLGDIGGWISSLKGPIEKDAVLLTPHGKAIIGGLMDGMQSQIPAMERQLKGFTKTIQNTFGKQYATDISANLSASLGSAQYQMANYQQGGRLPAANSTQMHFAAGSFVIQSGKSEKPSDTITRVLQGAAKFGSIQSPVGYSIGG